MKKVSARFPEELLQEVSLIAQLQFTDRATIMKQALRDYIQKGLAAGGLEGVGRPEVPGGPAL